MLLRCSQESNIEEDDNDDDSEEPKLNIQYKHLTAAPVQEITIKRYTQQKKRPIFWTLGPPQPPAATWLENLRTSFGRVSDEFWTSFGRAGATNIKKTN